MFGQELSNLIYLRINYTYITELPPTFGQGLSQLSTLNLNHNHIKSLPPTFGQGLSQLNKLCIKNNNFNKKGKKALKKCEAFFKTLLIKI
jgi:Leucine-rich repeat (LRR) protein